MRIGAALLVLMIAYSALGEGLKVCNRSSESVRIAVGWSEHNEVVSDGWWTLEPDTCKLPVASLPHATYYLYVTSRDPHSELRWDGSEPLCVEDDNFTIHGDDCTDTRDFVRLPVGMAASWQAEIVDDESDASSAADSVIAAHSRFGDLDDEDFEEELGDEDFEENLDDYTLPAQSQRPTRGSFGVPFQSLEVRVPIQGRDVRIWLSGNAVASFSEDRFDLAADVYANLSDLRAQIGPIIQSGANQSDDCGHNLNVHTVDFSVTPPYARLFAAAHYELWNCGSIDLGPFGEVDVYKTKVLEQSGDITAQAIPFVDGSGGSVGLQLNVVSVGADGTLGQLMGINVIGEWVLSQVRNAVPSAINVGRLQDALPPQLRGVPVYLSNVQFVDLGNGVPGIHANLSTTITGQQANQIVAAFGY